MNILRHQFSFTCIFLDAEDFLEDLVKRLLEEKQNERRLEKERQGKAREEKKGSNKLLYELEKILKRQDPDCKSKDVDCDHWNQVPIKSVCLYVCLLVWLSVCLSV